MDAHEPHLPVDVSPAMHQLVAWLRDAKGSTVVRSAAAHAWLTHIHPFEDGNGRVARLLANLVLTSDGLPPAIVKHANERETYLDALRHSDSGGDILPLSGLFVQSLRRYVKEVEKPRFLRKVFRLELARRGGKLYDWWEAEFERFISVLQGELALANLHISKAGHLDVEGFELLRKSDSTGNTWSHLVYDNNGHEVLLWFGYPSTSMNADLGRAEHYPSLYFSVRSEPYRIEPFRRAYATEVGGLREVSVIPDLPTAVYARVNETLRKGLIVDAASEVSDRLADAFRKGTMPTTKHAARYSDGSS